jgi:hypothetical protein
MALEDNDNVRYPVITVLLPQQSDLCDFDIQDANF